MQVIDNHKSAVKKYASDYVIMDLLANRERYAEAWNDDQLYLRLGLRFSFPAIALFEFHPNSSDPPAVKKWNDAARDFLEQASPESRIFKNDEGNVGMLFSWRSKSMLAELKRKLEQQLLVQVSIGVGLPCNQLTNLFQSYGQALIALKDKFYKGIGKVIFFSEVKPYKEACNYPYFMEEDLYAMLKAPTSYSALEPVVQSFYDLVLQDGPVEISVIQEITMRLMIGLEKRMLTETGEANMEMRPRIISIVKMETLQQIKSYLTDYLYELNEKMTGAHLEINHKTIQKAIQYMEQDCRHATLNSIAEKVSMTPTYLSLIFKLNTGKTFIDHLTDVRIRKAKKLLKCTNLKNYEVSEQIGYHDSRYFSQVFKKRVGVSPSEYRESLRK